MLHGTRGDLTLGHVEILDTGTRGDLTLVQVGMWTRLHVEICTRVHVGVTCVYVGDQL